MQVELIKDIGAIIAATLGLYLTIWGLRQNKNYWAHVARVTGLSPAPRGQKQKIAENLKWFIPYISRLRDKTIYTLALSELEGTQHNRQTSLAMYEITQRILGVHAGKAYFCVQRFELKTDLPQLFIVAKTIRSMQVALQIPQTAHTSRSLPDFTVTYVRDDGLWTKLEPIWQTSYAFCTKQKLGLLIQDGYLFLYSPYRPVDIKTWVEFSGQLLAAIDEPGIQA